MAGLWRHVAAACVAEGEGAVAAEEEAAVVRPSRRVKSLTRALMITSRTEACDLITSRVSVQ